MQKKKKKSLILRKHLQKFTCVPHCSALTSSTSSSRCPSFGLVTKFIKMAALARKTSRKRKRQRTEISFAPGFHLPTPKQSRNAVGLSSIPKLFEPGPENVYFTKVPHPTCQDDWLAQYNEEGQSFKNFVRTCPWISGRKVKFVRQNFIPEGRNLKERYPNGKIYIQPLGDFNQSSSDCSPCIDDLADFTQRFYGLPVVILPVVSIKLPESKGKQSIGRNCMDLPTVQPRAFRRILVPVTKVATLG